MPQFDLLLPPSSAEFSPCNRYRYTLTRRWSVDGPSVLWIMLNPSTATAESDDPTIRRCMEFSREWGFGGLTVTNVYAFRATDPDELLVVPDPVGPDNDRAIRGEIERHETIVCAWGKRASRGRVNAIALMAMVYERQLMCLKQNKDGSPQHPLYIPGTTPLQPLVLR